MTRPIRSLHPPSPLVVPILEHVLVLWIQGPVVALAFASAFPGDFHEALVQTQIVPDRVLPALFVLLEVRKAGRYVAVDFTQGGPFQLGVLKEKRGRDGTVWRSKETINWR